MEQTRVQFLLDYAHMLLESDRGMIVDGRHERIERTLDEIEELLGIQTKTGTP